jgi:hypothetical protein
MRRRLPFFLLVLCFVLPAFAKDTPLTIDWPEKTPVIRFTVIKFHSVGSSGSERTYTIDMSAHNMTAKLIPSASPQFMLYDKKGIRIGDGYLHLSNLRPNETIKFTVNAFCSGSPEKMSLVAVDRKVNITIYSVPSGAQLSVDGAAVGTTPIAIDVAPGSHNLEFAKEGYNRGTFPLAISANQLSGGSITYELGGSSYDTVELRDGTVISGDVEEVNATQVVVRVGGNMQALDRNQVKRISLIQRQPPPAQK